MRNESLIRVLSLSDISKAKTLIPDIAFYLEKKTQLLISEKTRKYNTDSYKYIILFHNKKRVGGILLCGNSDIHMYIFKKYRGKGYMSNFIKSGWIKKLSPNLQSITCIHPYGSSEYKCVEHLAKLAKLQIKNN